MKWKENHNYYILKTEHINTNIEASYILMQNVTHTCAIVSNQSRSKKDVYFYLVEIASEIKEKVSLNNMYFEKYLEKKELAKSNVKILLHFVNCF
jgi:hypothetical protein